MAWLEDHPPARSQYRKPRRAALSGVIVVHTAENAPDYVAFDGGAEAVANFIRNRTDPGSYHDLVDSDSAIGLVDYDDEAFHDGTGSNPHSLGLCVATRADAWPFAPQEWREGAVEQAAQRAARMARHVHARTGIVIPPRRLSRAESEAPIPGFISHALRDPARRSDPGQDFPWGIFLARYAALTGDLTAPDQEDPFMALTNAEQQEILAAVRQTAWPPGTPKEAQHRLWDLALWTLAELKASHDPEGFAAKVAEHLDTVTAEEVTEAVKRALREGSG